VKTKTTFADEYAEPPAGSATARANADELGIPVITPATAAVLTVAAKAVGAKQVVEVGTGTGVSALALLAGMAPEGTLTSIDPENDLQILAKETILAQGVAARRFRPIAGRPLNVLPKLTDGAYDVVYVDGDPLEYVEYVAQAGRLLRSGGALILHHALWKGQVADSDDDEPLIIREALAAVQESERYATALIPLGDGLLLAVAD
jgi:predicted O-methyltransferase YrrM